MAAGSSRVTLTSSAITVNRTGSPTCVNAEISSNGLSNDISPENMQHSIHYYDFEIIRGKFVFLGNKQLPEAGEQNKSQNPDGQLFYAATWTKRLKIRN